MEPLARCRLSANGFPPWIRLTRGTDFQAAFHNRCCVSEGWLALYGIPNGLTYSRFGLSIGKRLVGNNVRRNKVRRLLREVIRLRMNQIPPGYDWVLTSRRGGIPQLGELLSTLPRLAQQVFLRLRGRPIRPTPKLPGGHQGP